MVAVLAPQESSFLGLVSVVAPVIATGNTAVVGLGEVPTPALSLGEVLATSDLPGGVVNILSGRTAEIAAPLAAHQDVNAIDLAGADDALAKELEIAAADDLKRVLRPQPVDHAATPGIDRMTAFLETQTIVAHPRAPSAPPAPRTDRIPRCLDVGRELGLRQRAALPDSSLYAAPPCGSPSNP
ncbi:hypothetical protein SGLAM104S_01869 [Streptomyces glaucescens]